MHKEWTPVAVIDIGSNAVRLVVFHDSVRVPVQLHTERTICGLGKTLGKTGRLNPEGVTMALDSLARFSSLIKSMKIKDVRAVATAALRDAEDGPEFVEKVEREFGLKIQVIPGEEEARLSALGVVANHGHIDGLIGDFGGGSLELIGMKKGKITSQDSYPLGALRIMAYDTMEARENYIRSYLDTLDLSQYEGQRFYVLGGAWRTLARAHIYINDYPIKVLDNYRLDYKKALEFTRHIAKQDHASLERMAGMSKRRVSDMAAAALVMKHVLKAARPEKLVFSGSGLREGLMYDHLPPKVQKQRPLLAGCREIGRETSRFAADDELQLLLRWVTPLFEDPSESDIRSIEAACYLSDVGWFEHEDHRARHAYFRILNLPLYGLSHKRRAMLALAVYVRHKGYLRKLGREGGETTVAAQKILSEHRRDEAVVLGLGMRLAYILTGGALSLLKYTSLKMSDQTLTLEIKGRHAGISGDIIRDLLEDIAKKRGRTAQIAQA